LIKNKKDEHSAARKGKLSIPDNSLII